VTVVRLPPRREGDEDERLDVTIAWRTPAGPLGSRLSSHRTTLAAHPDMPALVVWPGGPGAIVWVTPDPGPRAPLLPAWRRVPPRANAP
jgi:hypothetical protein